MKKQTVVIAFDGSVYANKSISYAVQNFEKGSRIILVYVEQNITPLYLADQSLFVDNDIIKRIREKSIETIKRAANSIKDKGFNSSYVYMDGYPPDQIINAAKKQKADIIIIGSRGMGKWKGAVLGSVSQAVAIKSKIPVLIIK